jgi:bacterioferritin-associated ferredoxin
MKFNFTIIPLVMACALHSGPDPAANGAPDTTGSGFFPHAVPPPMTRCECADVSFEEIAREAAAGASFDEARRRTGCGQTCTACLPDLRRFLESSSL